MEYKYSTIYTNYIDFLFRLMNDSTMQCLLHILVILLGISFVATQTKTTLPLLILPRCGTNQEYTTCATACPPTCDDLHYPLPKPPKPCPLYCKAGCVCMKGYYRATDGSCVPPDQCCGDNEIYKTCGSACVETCDNKPTLCTKQCVIGCFCACSNYVRQSNSTNSPCIPRDDCPGPCAEEEV